MEEATGRYITGTTLGGGQPASQQLAFYVNLKEIPNNRFGTQSEIYWDGAYLGAQVGAVTRGSYSLRKRSPATA